MFGTDSLIGQTISGCAASCHFRHDEPVGQLGAGQSAIGFLDISSGTANIWTHQAFAPGPARQLTHFTAGRAWTFAWSPDGKQLAFGYGNNSSDVVLFSQPK